MKVQTVPLDPVEQWRGSGCTYMEIGPNGRGVEARAQQWENGGNIWLVNPPEKLQDNVASGPRTQGQADVDPTVLTLTPCGREDGCGDHTPLSAFGPSCPPKEVRRRRTADSAEKPCALALPSAPKHAAALV